MHLLFSKDLPEYLAVTSFIAMSKQVLGQPTLRKEVETFIKTKVQAYACDKNYGIADEKLAAFFDAYFDISKAIQDHIRSNLISDQGLNYDFSSLETSFLMDCKSQLDEDLFDLSNINSANDLYQAMQNDKALAQAIFDLSVKKIGATNPLIVDSLAGENYHSNAELVQGYKQGLSQAIDAKLLQDPTIEASANGMVAKAIDISPVLNNSVAANISMNTK